ncbi:MAG TPA: hypothetical protein VNT75_22080 [Symbiobacteriaceae bacterium]|nr:hypothetical protein [Symbiobacteriaceae bacterium]
MAEVQQSAGATTGEQPVEGTKKEKQPDYSLATLSGCLVFATPLLLGPLWLAEALWRPLGNMFYLIMMGFSFAVVSDTALSKKKVVPDAASQAATLAAIVVILVSFSQLSRHYYIRHGGFEAASDNYWHWLRYGTNAVANALLRGVPEVWAWPVTEIRPTAFWPRAMLVLFQLAADVLAIGGLLRYVQTLFTRSNKPKAEAGTYPRYMARGLSQILGLACWGIPLALGIDAMLHGGWNPASAWPAIRMMAPVVVGIFLVQRSFRALRVLPGRWNALGAAVGMGIGAWMIWSSWAA